MTLFKNLQAVAINSDCLGIFEIKILLISDYDACRFSLESWFVTNLNFMFVQKRKNVWLKLHEYYLYCLV